MNLFKSLIKTQQQPMELRYVFNNGPIKLTEIPKSISNKRHYFKVWINRGHYVFRKDFKFTRPLHMTRRYRSLFLDYNL
jgi:hypothetical protein